MGTIWSVLGDAAREAGRSLGLLARNPMGMFGLVMVLIIALVTFVGPLFVPPATQANVAEIYQGPSLRHPLGTDFQGKDNLVQLIHGGRDVLVVAFVAGILTTVIAVTLGSLSAFLGGVVDTILMEVVNIWLTIPHFPLLAILATMLKMNNTVLLALVLALLSWAGLARQVRAQVLSLKKRDYVEAAIALDLGTRHIIFREMLPNMMSFIAISLIFAMTQAIYQQTSLVFLGLIPFSSANWGVTLSLAYGRGALFDASAAWNILSPVGAIALFQLSLVSLSRSLDEVFNPRLRAGA